MKLSEAISMGAVLDPQAFNSHTKNATCALQAAARATGISTSAEGIYQQLPRMCPFLNTKGHLCPVEGCDSVLSRPNPEGCIPEVYMIIYHLNDSHFWSRERIAEWVAAIEPTADAALEPVVAEQLMEVRA